MMTDVEEMLIYKMSEHGFGITRIELRDRNVKGMDLYYYVGPYDSANRSFCRAIMELDKLWSADDLDVLSQLAGYDVFEYAGSFGCRHTWVRYRSPTTADNPVTDNQIRKIGEESIANWTTTTKRKRR